MRWKYYCLDQGQKVHPKEVIFLDGFWVQKVVAGTVEAGRIPMVKVVGVIIVGLISTAAGRKGCHVMLLQRAGLA